MEKYIFEAARTGNIKMLDSIDAKMLYCIDDYGRSLLHAAIAFRQDEAAFSLIEKEINLNVQDKDGKTALMYAATYQNAKIVEKLLCAGVKINLVDKYGNTALWNALLSSIKDYDLFSFILSKGGGPKIKNSSGVSVIDLAINNKNMVLQSILANNNSV